MITVTKGHAILQLPCGCNSRKFWIADPEEDEEIYDADMKEIEEFVVEHEKFCWSKRGKK